MEVKTRTASMRRSTPQVKRNAARDAFNAAEADCFRPSGSAVESCWKNSGGRILLMRTDARIGSHDFVFCQRCTW